MSETKQNKLGDFASLHLAVSRLPQREVTSHSEVMGQLIEVKISGGIPGGLKRTRKERKISNK